MKYKISPLTKTHATAASLLVQESFLALAALDWSDCAQAEFLAATAPESLAKKLDEMVYSAGAFHENELLGVVMMPKSTLLGLFFVKPSALRNGIGKALWESVRTHIETSHPEIETIELNATPYALPFYLSLGFVPLSSEFEKDGRRAIRMACWLPARSLDAGRPLPHLQLGNKRAGANV